MVKREDNSSSFQQQWVSPNTLAEVFSELEANKVRDPCKQSQQPSFLHAGVQALTAHQWSQGTGAIILAGNTAAGVYHEWPEAPVIINIRGVRELSCKIDRSKAR